MTVTPSPDDFPYDPNETTDSDGDGIGDNSDPCIFDPNQECYCENDIDNDGICDDEEIFGCTLENAENYNSDATNPDQSCIYEEDEEIDEPEIILSSQSEFCDDVNPHHCMLPFPAPTFLLDDESSNTGYRLHIPGEAIPDSGSTPTDEFHMINRLDGYSPSTQIFTAFDSTPNVSQMADQYNIGDSLNPEHETILINLDNGEIIQENSNIDFPGVVTVSGLDPGEYLIQVQD